MKSLVAYYSRTNITKRLAEDIADKLGGDIEEIKPKVNYQGKLGYARGIKDGAAGKREQNMHRCNTGPQDKSCSGDGTGLHRSFGTDTGHHFKAFCPERQFG